ncbi:Mitochondrial uncoupling protein 1, partial [Bienertia sinuspersici]
MQFKMFFIGAFIFGDFPLLQKILAALLTGAIAITIANPTNLLKTRLAPNVARNVIINAAELNILAIPGFTDNALTHIIASLGAGVFAVYIGSHVYV